MANHYSVLPAPVSAAKIHKKAQGNQWVPNRPKCCTIPIELPPLLLKVVGGENSDFC